MRYEVYSQRPKLFQSENELFDAPRESVKPPNDHHVEQTASRIGDKCIETRTFLLGAARSVRVDLMELPTALLHQFPKRLLLDFEVFHEVDRIDLFEFSGSGDAHVDCCVSAPCHRAVTYLFSLVHF